MDVNDLEFHGIQFEVVCSVINKMRIKKYFCIKINIIPKDFTDTDMNYRTVLLSFTNYQANATVSVDHFGKVITITKTLGE